jgi:hypothetical protein
MHATHDVDAPAGPPVTFDDFLHGGALISIVRQYIEQQTTPN